MKIGADNANLSDLLRRFNLPLPTGAQRPAGTGTAPTSPQPSGTNGTPAGSNGTPAGSNGTPAAPANPAVPRPPAAPSPSAQPNLATLLDAVGGFDVTGTAPEPRPQAGTATPHSDARANQRSEQQTANGRAEPHAGRHAGDEGRFISRVSPQVLPRTGLTAPTPQTPQAPQTPQTSQLPQAQTPNLSRGAPDPRPLPADNTRSTAELGPGPRPDARIEARVDAPAQRPEPPPAPAEVEVRAATELPRRELLVRADHPELRGDIANQSALSPRAPTLEMATMQHWAAVEVGARTLPRNVRGHVVATPSDPPKKGNRSRRGEAGPEQWFGAAGTRSGAYTVMFTLLGLLVFFLLARSCSG